MSELAAAEARRSALDGLLRAMRVVPRSADSAELIATAVSALHECEIELREAGLSALPAVIRLDELSHPHLRVLSADIVTEGSGMTVHGLSEWRLGSDFLTRLASAYEVALDCAGAGGIRPNARVEILVRRMRAQASQLKWRAMAYYAADALAWNAMIETLARAQREGLHGRHIALRQGRNAHTSVEREFVRAFALGCAWLDQLTPDGIDIADRLVRYVLPMLQLTVAETDRSRFVLPFDPVAAPRRLNAAGAGGRGLFLATSEVGPVLDELASVIAKGLVPAALASGAQARERVLSAIFHLRRLWCGAPRTRRFRRHVLTGRVKAAMGFRRLKVTLASATGQELCGQGWQMVDVSRNGVGVLVPADDCGQLVVGDLVGIRVDDGRGWHIGLVRRIVRGTDGVGIVGLESITQVGTVASLDDGRAPVEVIVLDPVRRGATVRVALAAGGGVHADPVYLNQGGRICKLKRLSRVVQGTGFEVFQYRVL